MIYYTGDQIVESTSRWRGERFGDGKPRVPDYLLDKLRTMTIEEIWLPLFPKDYKFQFEGEMKRLHDGLKLVGRAIAAVFMSAGPDLAETVRAEGDARGY